jgi:CRISPR-associated endonuclease/helicase Cas3
MKTPTFQAWGKLHRSGGDIDRIHTLCDHMTDVAACLVAIARCPAVRQALDAAAGRRLTEVDLARLAVLAFLHDIGKANTGFQGRRWLTSDPRSRHWPHACGHGTEGWLLFSDSGVIPNAADILRDMPRASGGHRQRIQPTQQRFKTLAQNS